MLNKLLTTYKNTHTHTHQHSVSLNLFISLLWCTKTTLGLWGILVDSKTPLRSRASSTTFTCFFFQTGLCSCSNSLSCAVLCCVVLSWPCACGLTIFNYPSCCHTFPTPAQLSQFQVRLDRHCVCVWVCVCVLSSSRVSLHLRSSSQHLRLLL